MDFTLVDLQANAGPFGFSTCQIAVNGVIATWAELISVFAIVEFAIALLVESMPTNITK
jgi:hypothetical protein